MLFDAEMLEKELYRPVRDISNNYSINNPEFFKQIEFCVNQFTNRYDKSSYKREVVCALAFSAAQNYLIGKTEKMFEEQLLMEGIDGIRFLIGSYLKAKELELREKELDKNKTQD